MKLGLKVAGVSLAIAFLPMSRAICQEVSSSWQGLEYVRLPPKLCSGTSASLIGKLNNEQYSSLICQQQSHSYIFIQKLIGYSNAEESIWKIQNITQMPELNKQEFILQLGCRHSQLKRATIFAIVRSLDGDDLLVMKAWRVNLIREKLEEVESTKVVCYAPSLW